jgi:hypothetical protein
MIVASVLHGVATTELGGMAAMILKFGGCRFRVDITGLMSRQRRSFDDDISIAL